MKSRTHSVSPSLFNRRPLGLAIALACVAGVSWAQAPAAPEKKKEEDASKVEKLETINVTAQRREQELQQVPLPVTTITWRELETRGVSSTLRVAETVPNMVAQNNTGLGTANVYFIRGLGNTESIATFDPPVGTYVNDIYVSRQNANNLSFFDIERVEVLRGPQGTLFGRNTTGGAINIIMRKPSDKRSGYFSVGAGNYGGVTSRGSIDLPVSQDFRTKLSYYFSRDDGYVDNITTGQKLNGVEFSGFRGAFLWRVNDRVNWDFSVDANTDDGLSLYNRRDGDRRLARTGYRTDNGGFFTPTGAARLTGAKNGYGLGNEVKSTNITSNVTLSLDNVSVDFITGVRDLEQKYGIDFGDTPVPSGGFTIVNDGRHKQFTQEIKASGESNGLSYVGGFFYMDEDNSTDFGDIFNTSFSGAPLPGATLVLADRVLKNTTKTSAIYAQADWKLTPKFTATAGLRYTTETKKVSFSDNRSGIAAASQLSDANIAAAGIPLSQKTNLATPRFALAYQHDKDTMYFASVTRGFKSGGWNARGTSAAVLQPFEPEKVWSYEAGWRTDLVPNVVRLNGTFFLSETEKLQTPSGFVAPSGAVSFITRNFSDLRNQGLELELTATPTRGLSTYVSVGLQDPKYVNIAESIRQQQAACQASIAANAAARPSCLNGIVTAGGEIATPVRTPKTSVAVGGTYVFPIGMGGLRMSTTGNIVYASRMSVGTANNAFADAHTSLNAAVALLGTGESWRLTLDCSNCTNKSWFTSHLAGLNYLNDPRRYSIKLHYTFK
jgi:iron complex outermembrane recepter protein